MKTYKDCFYYFIEKYKKQTGHEYSYFKKRLGLEFMKIKRLNLIPKKFMNFINWLYSKRKLSSINFLTGQLNDYYSSKEYTENMLLEKAIIHHKIMSARQKIVENCKICGGYGRLKDFSQCKCLIAFMKERDKIKKEFK